MSGFKLTPTPRDVARGIYSQSTKMEGEDDCVLRIAHRGRFIDRLLRSDEFRRLYASYKSSDFNAQLKPMLKTWHDWQFTLTTAGELVGSSRLKLLSARIRNVGAERHAA